MYIRLISILFGLVINLQDFFVYELYRILIPEIAIIVDKYFHAKDSASYFLMHE